MADDDLTPERTMELLGQALWDKPVPVAFDHPDERGMVDPASIEIDLTQLAGTLLAAIAEAELRIVRMPLITEPPEAAWERARAVVTAWLADMPDEATAITIADPTPHITSTLLANYIHLLLIKHAELLEVDVMEFWRVWCAQPTNYDEGGLDEPPTS